MTLLSDLRERLRWKPFRSYPLWRQGLAVVLIAIGVVAAGAGGWAGYLRVTGNIHEVDPGQVYRSGQLWPGQLDQLLREKGMRTVINLRGENPGRDWYDDEIRVTEAAGVRHVSLSMSANVEPSPELLARLINTLGSALQPMLIHYEAGADRSGLASALYQLIHKARARPRPTCSSRSATGISHGSPAGPAPWTGASGVQLRPPDAARRGAYILISDEGH